MRVARRRCVVSCDSCHEEYGDGGGRPSADHDRMGVKCGTYISKENLRRVVKLSSVVGRLTLAWVRDTATRMLVSMLLYINPTLAN